MELNALESSFFNWILNAELDVPIPATLEVGDRTFDCIIVPEIDQEGDFKFKYYNASETAPDTAPTTSASGTKSWPILQALGLDPLLERAWLSGDPVTVNMRPMPLPIEPRPARKIDASVRYAEFGNTGALGLDKNQVLVQDTPLRKSEFSLVGFPDFRLTHWHGRSISGIASQTLDHLQSISEDIGEGFNVVIQSSLPVVDLDSKDGWNIRLSRDEKPTRTLVGHTGLITRTDDKNFEADELDEVLEALKYFLAFSAGAYFLPTVVIGVDSRNRPTLGKIGRFHVERPLTANWFRARGIPDGVLLEDLFPGFWRRWKMNKDEIIAILECYVHSNVMRQAGVPNDAVAKSYSGLEVLSGLILGKTIGRDSHKKINQVLSRKQIPHVKLDSSETPVMAKLCSDLDVGDLIGSHLLGNVRNYVSHPLDPKTPAEVKERHRKYLDSDRSRYAYLHDLSQFYLEYLLLDYCGIQTSEHRRLLEAMQKPMSE